MTSSGPGIAGIAGVAFKSINHVGRTLGQAYINRSFHGPWCLAVVVTLLEHSGAFTPGNRARNS